MTNDDLLDRMKELLDRHGQAIADLQDRMRKHDELYGRAITRLHERFDEHELWAKEVLELLKKLEGKK